MRDPDEQRPDAAPQPQIADRETFTQVFRRFYTPLARYACRITGDPATASDVLQDVFAKLWEDRERVTVQVSLQALLYTMVRNRALNVNRKAHLIAADVGVEDVRDRFEDTRPNEAVLEAKELGRYLNRWAGNLPPRQAEAFMLSRYHDLTHREIAVIMGISERTVDTHILLALRELRRRLDALQHSG